MLDEKQLELLSKQKTVALTTANSDGQPRSIFVEINKIDNDHMIITDNHMMKTIENIKQNNKVFILDYQEDYNYIIYITGEASYIESSELFDFVKNNPDNDGYQPKGAIDIKINQVEEMTF